jgi:hypothetical protein
VSTKVRWTLSSSDDLNDSRWDGRALTTVLHFEPIDQRGFGEWAMAFAGIEDEVGFDIEGILESKDKIKAEETGRNLVSTLDRLMRQHQSLVQKI